jgi:DNA-binding PadR family transcriptional regulator
MFFACDVGPGYGGWMGSRWSRGPRRSPPGFGYFAEFFAEPSPRAERGEVRYLVLDALGSASRHGYEVIQFIEQRSRGGYRPSPGVIYPTLQLLDELGQAHSVEQEGRKVYAITDAGRRELEENRQAVEDFYERFEEQPWEMHADEIAALAQRFARLVKAFRRAARRGQVRPTTMRAVQQVLDEALGKIEGIFTDSDRR